MTDAERQDMTCATCVWFRPWPKREPTTTVTAHPAAGQTFDAYVPDLESDGECRRFPPSLVHATAGSANTWFPEVDGSHWCGEWRK